MFAKFYALMMLFTLGVLADPCLDEVSDQDTFLKQLGIFLWNLLGVLLWPVPLGYIFFTRLERFIEIIENIGRKKL